MPQLIATGLLELAGLVSLMDHTGVGLFGICVGMLSGMKVTCVMTKYVPCCRTGWTNPRVHPGGDRQVVCEALIRAGWSACGDVLERQLLMGSPAYGMLVVQIPVPSILAKADDLYKMCECIDCGLYVQSAAGLETYLFHG
jgi:hypothetical protein